MTIIRGKREAIQHILESHRGNERADSHMTVRTNEGGIAVFTAMKVFRFSRQAYLIIEDWISVVVSLMYWEGENVTQIPGRHFNQIPGRHFTCWLSSLVVQEKLQVRFLDSAENSTNFLSTGHLENTVAYCYVKYESNVASMLYRISHLSAGFPKLLLIWVCEVWKKCMCRLLNHQFAISRST